MSEWAAKRFWKDVGVTADGAGFSVWLDDRPLRTPAKRALVMPTEAMAQRVAREWDEQKGVIDPAAMPWTRSANSAVDKVGPQRAEVEAHLAGYAATDHLCYRADGPVGLAARQSAHWDPLIDWAASRFDVSLNVTSGVMPVEQPDKTLGRFRQTMAPLTDFELTGFHDLVTLSGSFLIALAVLEGRESPEALWRASRIDEDWQVEQWGEDEEAAEHATLRQAAFLHGADFLGIAK